MAERKTWLVTGAGRGMGVSIIPRAALAAGHGVVATGRNPGTVKRTVSEAEGLLVGTRALLVREHRTGVGSRPRR
jgi:NAD(P)-dependent dehydrogenase (short-subunit alcohol dehydrogenase family)